MKIFTSKLGERIINLEENEANSEQYNRRNNVELFGIPSDIQENNLEKVMIDIYRNSGLEIEQNDIKAYFRLLLSEAVGSQIKNYCSQKNLRLINHDNIKENHLGVKKLHLNRKGNSLFAKNLLNFIESS